MPQTKPFLNLTKEIEQDPVQIQRVRDMTRTYRDTNRLMSVRKQRNLTRQSVADVLNVSSASVSRIEHEDDVYLSTPRGYIEVLGGDSFSQPMSRVSRARSLTDSRWFRRALSCKLRIFLGAWPSA